MNNLEVFNRAEEEDERVFASHLRDLRDRSCCLCFFLLPVSPEEGEQPGAQLHLRPLDLPGLPDPPDLGLQAPHEAETGEKQVL